jgi:flagellar biosynthesis protein
MEDNLTDKQGDALRKWAVALEYDQEEDGAPRVTARGSGYIAEKIIEIAEEHGVPIYEDPDLVQFLSKLDIDREIPVELYRAVAEVLAFVYRLNSEASTVKPAGNRSGGSGVTGTG